MTEEARGSAAMVAEIAARFSAAGIGNARSEAVWLAEHVTGLSRAELLRDAALPADTGVRLRALADRRAAREPLQHVLGTAPFLDLGLLSDRRALVPREDTGCVAEAALAVLPEGGPVRFADLGTGSGALLTALLVKRPAARGTGIDLSADALALAADNLRKHGVTDRAELVCADWADWEGWGEAALIVSNPPYIASGELASLPPEVRNHDPMLALDGGADGLRAYRTLITLFAERARPGAWLVLELGDGQFEPVRNLAGAAGLEQAEWGADLQGLPRWLRALKA